MSFADIRASHMRIAVLGLLAQDPGYDINEYILRDLLKQYSHDIGRDKLRTELAWLAEQGLVTLTEFEGVQVAKLTPRGNDVAKGRVIVMGWRLPHYAHAGNAHRASLERLTGNILAYLAEPKTWQKVVLAGAAGAGVFAP